MMRRIRSALIAVLLIWAAGQTIDAQDAKSDAGPVTFAQTDWPWWRGPERNGVASANQKPPLKWSATENVVWKSPIHGRGHGSPTVVGDQIFLATAEHGKDVQSVLCYDRKTGKLLWQTEVHRGGFEKKGNAKSSLASSTVAGDGRRLFINFLHAGAVYTTALDRDGNKIWQTKITDYVIHQGYGSSPTVYEDLVLVTADNKGGGAVAGLERATGKIVWKHERPATPNYASPIVLKVAGRDQLLLTGCDLVSGFEPRTGKKLWEVPGATTETVTSTVTDGRLMYTTGGYPRNHVSAVVADGSGKVVWENSTRIYVPSMLLHEGHLYAVQDAGVAMCWKCDTGAEVWKDRLGGTFSSSPVLVGEHVYATNEAGRTSIFKASPEGLDVIAENQLGEDVLATPAICGGRIYARVAHREAGERREMLYCLGN
jgi:outer membrane protein assembly factor BamB